MADIDPPWRLDPLQTIVGAHWKTKKIKCSGGGFLAGSAELAASTVYFDEFGNVGYCFQVFPQTVGEVDVYIFQLMQSMDPSVPNTPAWQAANNYPGDLGAAAAISVWNQFAEKAIAFFSPFTSDPNSLDPVPGFGPYAQNVGSRTVTCNHTDPNTGITTGAIGASPSGINGGNGFKNKNFCKGDIF